MGIISEKKEVKRNLIIKSARELFKSNGIKDTTVDMITKKAGLAKGTFYLYFKDKYEVEKDIIIMESQNLFNSALKYALQHKDAKYEDKIIYLIDYIINELNKNKYKLKLIYKNLSWGIYHQNLLSVVESNKNKLIESLLISEEKRNDLHLVYLKMYLIIEFVGSACYSPILYGEPLSIEEIKPYIYSEIKKMLKD